MYRDSGGIHSPIHILDATTGQLLMTFSDPNIGPNNALAWSPDSTRVLSGDTAGQLDIWNVVDGTHTVLRRDAAPSEGVGWSPTGNAILKIAVGSIHLMDPVTGSDLPNQLNLRMPMTQAAVWNSDGSQLAAVGRENIRVWDTNTINVSQFGDRYFWGWKATDGQLP